MTTKLLWHSNAPFVPTGYGNQTALFTPLLTDHYDLAISAFFGLEGAPIRWGEKRIPILPGLGAEYGDMTLPQHAARFFGDPRGGLVVTLMDNWVLNPEAMRGLNMAAWIPVDHEPAPPQLVNFFEHSEAIPIAFSRFGEQQLAAFDPLYAPHGVDCKVFKRRERQAARAGQFPDGAFVCGMVAANKGHPSRKGFTQALTAFTKFAQSHEDAYLYLHTVLNANVGHGENLVGLVKSLGIPPERIRIADQYTLLYQPFSPEAMSQIYSAMDVLLNPAWGEGFGIPIMEAQACGVPCVVTDFSAMREVCGAGWHVKWAPYWSGLDAWQAIPDIDEIVAALEECHAMTPAARAKLSAAACHHARAYDVRRVFSRYLLPALRECERRFSARAPVRIPSRLEKVAA